MAMDLQSTDGGKRLKLVAAIGNAPIYSALQAGANLSQLSSQFEIHGFWGYPGNLAQSATNPFALFQYFTTLSAFGFTSHSANSWAVMVIPRHEPLLLCIYYTVLSRSFNFFFQLS